MERLARPVDRTGLVVADVGAGTGRSTHGAARAAKEVVAVDFFRPVLECGRRKTSPADLCHIPHLVGDCDRPPLREDSDDAVLSVWARRDLPEAYRVLRPRGHVIPIGDAPGSGCGEVAACLAETFPDRIREVGPNERFDSSCRPTESTLEGLQGNGIPVENPVRVHDLTRIAKCRSVEE